MRYILHRELSDFSKVKVDTIIYTYMYIGYYMWGYVLSFLVRTVYTFLQGQTIRCT